jgi:DNA mismatch endonuclease (patch repair protein)
VKDVKHLPGRPDIVFRRERVAIFCDGDFWHGRNWRRIKSKLAKGSNSGYWVNKIRNNMTRDRRYNAALKKEGWAVLRYWESDILTNSSDIAATIRTIVLQRRSGVRSISLYAKKSD